MIRFIFACTVVVGLSILATAGQFMINDINKAKQAVVARNTVPEDTTTAAASGPTFEEIYAMATARQDLSPEGLNDIETAAGGDDSFTGGFTNIAPKALAEKEPAPVDGQASSF